MWLWEGRTPVLPRPDIPTLTQCFDTETGSWLAPTAKEDGLPGLCEACVQVGTVVYCLVRIFRSACLTLFSSGLNATSTQFPRWEQVTQADYPLPWYEQIYLVSKGGQELLVLFAAKETAQLHVFDLSNKYWSVPEVSGMPPGLTGSTLTSVDELHAVLFGGGLPETNRAYLLDMGGWSWSEIASSSPLKPPPRSHHSACLITPTSSHPLLLVVGGLAPPSDPRCDLTHCDAWLLDFHAELWRRVDLPDAVQTSRCEHTASNINMYGCTQHVLVFGGIGSRGKILAKPVLLEITNGVFVNSLPPVKTAKSSRTLVLMKSPYINSERPGNFGHVNGLNDAPLVAICSHSHDRVI